MIELLCVKEISTMLRCSSRFVRKQISLGFLPATRLGRYVRVDKRAVIPYLDMRTEGGWQWGRGSDTSSIANDGRAQQRTAGGASARTSRGASRR